jgi:hypothetical protein
MKKVKGYKAKTKACPPGQRFKPGAPGGKPLPKVKKKK